MFGAFPMFAQKTNNLFFEIDSIIDNKLGVFYTYKFYKQELSNKKLLYSFETQTISIVENSRYLNKNYDYYLYVLYDEPTGRVFTLIYNYKNKSFFKSDWFDDKANGDYLIKDKVNFQKRYLTIKEKYLNKVYKVKLYSIK